MTDEKVIKVPEELGEVARLKRKAEPKQVIVMRTDLQMRKGKMIAQGAHASGKVFFDRIPQEVRDLGMPEGFERMRVPMEINRAMAAWLFDVCFAKICVRVESEQELVEVYERALGADLPCALITDAGRTEFHGVPTKTCCAIGPASPEDVDRITGHLKLL